MEDIKEEIKKVATEVDKVTEEILCEEMIPSTNLFHALKYSTLGGAKFRSYLIYKMCKELNINEKIALYLGACIEMIHSYTLVHDDLPCMDNSDTRRNKPSSHVKFNEFTAVLAGDALHSEAYYFLSSVKFPLSSDLRLEIIHIISKTIGARGLISGQMLDLAFDKNNMDKIDISHLTQIHLLKTANMISLCFLLPAIIANSTQEYRNKILRYGENLGLIYQIVDDFKDKDKQDENMNIYHILSPQEMENNLFQLEQEAKKLHKELELKNIHMIYNYILDSVVGNK